MKPTNEELKSKYTQKKQEAADRFTAVQSVYSSLKEEPSDTLLYEISLLGCKVMIANLKGHIEHCKRQIKKYATTNIN